MKQKHATLKVIRLEPMMEMYAIEVNGDRTKHPAFNDLTQAQSFAFDIGKEYETVTLIYEDKN